MTHKSTAFFTYCSQALKLILKKEYRGYLLWSFFASCIAFVCVLFVLFHCWHTLISLFNASTPGFLHFLDPFLWVTASVALFFGFQSLFLLISHVIAIPACILLCNRLMRNLYPKLPQLSNWHISTLVFLTKNTLRQIAYYALGLALTALIALIPVLNVLSPFAFFIFSLWFIATQLYSYPAYNHGDGFKLLCRFFNKNILNSTLLALSFMLVSAIPIVNLFILPLLITVATMMYCDSLSK